jgi:hypothetical protein
VFSVTIVYDWYTLVGLIVHSSIILLGLVSLYFFGDANFKFLKMVGPYQVGHKEYHLKIGNAASAFYPMDRKTYNKNINKKGRNTNWMRYGDKSLQGFT